jgi:hypothetical protein
VIKHYGFNFPPVGVIGVLEQVALPSNKIYILDPIGGEELPYHELDSDCYVIITTNEGSSHHWFDRLIPRLTSAGVSLDNIIIRSACLWDPDSPVRHIHTIVDECSDFVTMLKNYCPTVVTPTHHFVCLNHLHRWQRYQLVCQLLDKNLQNFGKLSYIEKPPGSDTRFPIILEQENLTWTEQRDISLSALTGAAFNIISETAYEAEPGATRLTHHHRPGMTEKSYKCFALFQIPVWLAPYRAVACYRELGFDVFDDVVDHAYDLEPDPVQRIKMVADQVQHICKIPKTNLAQLKTKLLPRFENNWNRLLHYSHNVGTELPQWQALF